MCGRFVQYSPVGTLKKSFNIKTITCEIIPSYNIAPTHDILTIIYHEEKRLGKLQWGFIPSWTKDISKASRIVNARAETVWGKPSFQKAFKYRRCLIPANGFYEWKRKDKQKYPWYCTLLSKEPFAFAGLWETWKEKDGSKIHTCLIITTESIGSMRKIHDRIPVILTPDVLDQWLNPENHDVKQLNRILKDAHVNELKIYPVAKLVNSLKNNNSKCIEPLI